MHGNVQVFVVRYGREMGLSWKQLPLNKLAYLFSNDMHIQLRLDSACPLTDLLGVGWYVCIYVCMYVSMYVSMYVCMYLCMYVCI